MSRSRDLFASRPSRAPVSGGAHRLPDRGNEAADVYADHRVGLRGETTGSARDARRAGALITTGSAGTSHVRGSFLLTASAEYRSRPPRRRVRVSAPAKRSGTARSCVAAMSRGRCRLSRRPRVPAARSQREARRMERHPRGHPDPTARSPRAGRRRDRRGRNVTEDVGFAGAGARAIAEASRQGAPRHCP
jgi:hypothetical protein